MIHSACSHTKNVPLDMTFAKAKSREQRRIERLLRSQEREVQDAFNVFLADVRSEEALREVRVLLQRGRINEALDIVDTHVVRLSQVFPQIFQQVGINESEALAAEIIPLGSRVAISFDPTHQRAADIMRRNRLEFVREFTRRQREATRTALVSALRTGQGPIQAASTFSNSIGLTSKQLASVDRFRQLLLNTPREALLRNLRDRRFDRTIIRALDDGDLLSNKQIDKMVDRFRERFIRFRSEVIARTETQSILNEARQESLQQAVDETAIDQTRITRIWNTSIDGRERQTHFAMDGQGVGVGEQFISPSGARLRFPGDKRAPIEEVAQCRCVVTLDISNP